LLSQANDHFPFRLFSTDNNQFVKQRRQKRNSGDVIIVFTKNMCAYNAQHFVLLADRTNGRAYATVLRPSVVCWLWRMYCG